MKSNNKFSPGLRMRTILLAVLLLATAACQTTPAPKPTLSPVQVTTLKNLGFAPSDDGWSLNLTTKPILFETGTNTLEPDDKNTVMKMAKDLLAAGIDHLRIEGHTDNIGAAELNRTLSLRRAEAVANEFARNGVPGANIERKGYGFDKPIADNATAQGRAQNRRVTIIVPSF